MPSKLENTMRFHLQAMSLPFVAEHRFCKRMWRFDFAIPELLIGIECEGGIFTNGAHTRGKHYESDMEKYNAASLLGWRVLRFSGDMIKNGYATTIIGRTITEVRALQYQLESLSVPISVLSPAVSYVPAFEKSPRRAITKMAIKKRRTTIQRNSGGVAK